MQLKIAYVLPVVTLLYSCGRPTSEKISDPLAIFPLNTEWEFISSKDKDRIIVLIKRTDDNKLTYRIELLRNYYGLPLDQGILVLNDAGNDSTFNFSGGNEECKLSLKMYQSTGPGGGKRMIIERTCNDTTKNISSSDFPPLWRRGEAHSR
jgi:hypothetical protein